ncbi:MAG TPA: inorganic diphosphatase [Candidatus Bathyarchaeia archaeon]|nr:MAG: inorganic pyrophosphatase [Candidatus Bathyarchaeota archaeon RBG_16_48_13]HJX23614.1 inorganic diphosphatase [Candidatus Bathyarchaeia archaeon]
MGNLWRDLPAGPRPPSSVYAVVEVPRECTNKYEFDWKNGVFKLNRVLYSALYYPGDYGIIPRTWYGDEDPLDILVLTTKPTFTGCVLEARPIGALLTEDEHGQDDKILAVPIRDPRWNEVADIKDLGKHIRFEIADFFLNYKKLEPEKWVNVKEWMDSKAAEEIILSAMQMYTEKFGKEC